MKCQCTFAQLMLGDCREFCQRDTYQKTMQQQRREIEREISQKDALNLARVDPCDDRFILKDDK